MSKYKTWWYWCWKRFLKLINFVDWTWLRAMFRRSGRGYNLLPEDHERLKALLAEGYYLVLTQRSSHLSTFGISVLSFAKTGVWPDYTHVLMNLDLEDDPQAFERFKLMEATGAGVHYSTFMDVFNCDSVCILEPVNMSHEDWNIVIEGLVRQLGKLYDNLFDLGDDSRVSCVELVLVALRASPHYQEHFPHLEEMIQKVGNLTPQMYRDCKDFKVVFEVKR